MTVPTAGLADTNIFVALEQDRPLAELPEALAVSVVTIGELELGVLATSDPQTRARRGETLSRARAADPLPVTEAVMVAWAHLVRECRGAGIHRTVKLTDALIAATAIAHGLPVVTQDADFDRMADVHAALDLVRV